MSREQGILTAVQSSNTFEVDMTYCIRHIFRESGATRKINNARNNIYMYLRSRRMNATCIHIQCTCMAHDTTSLILTSPFIALFDREFNHSRKCLKVLIREIYGVYSS